jgi:hypothetical protein
LQVDENKNPSHSHFSWEFVSWVVFVTKKMKIQTNKLRVHGRMHTHTRTCEAESETEQEQAALAHGQCTNQDAPKPQIHRTPHTKSNLRSLNGGTVVLYHVPSFKALNFTQRK